jgi:hypothetical protein
MKSCPTCNRTYPDDTLAFCLVDGAVLSAPYDPQETRRIPPPRTTSPPATEVFNPEAQGSSRSPLPSTIHGPVPVVPPLNPPNLKTATVESDKPNIVPWLVVAGAILFVGVFAVVMIVGKFSGNETSSRNQPSPEPQSSSPPRSGTMCGQTVSPALLNKWIELGGETGKLGCPINQETDAPASPQGSTGRWIHFAKGDGGYLIEYTRPEGTLAKPVPLAGHAFEVSGCMFKLYASLGGTKSWLGFPAGDGYGTSTGARQDFEGGYIVWDRKTYVCDAHE